MLVHSDDIPAKEHAPGLLCKKLIDGSQGSASLSMLQGWLKPGCEHALHTHDSEEIVVITSGSGVLEMDGRDYPVKAGDVMRFPAGSQHATRNTHPTEALEFIAAFDDQIVDATPAKKAHSAVNRNKLRWFTRKLWRKIGFK